MIFENVMLIPGFDSPNDVLNDFKTKAFRERLAWLLPRLKLFSMFWNRERFSVTQRSTSTCSSICGITDPLCPAVKAREVVKV